MIRLLACLKSAGVLFATLAVFASPQLSVAQSPLHGVLEKRVSTKGFQLDMKLREAMEMLRTMVLVEKEKTALPIYIDEEAFKVENADMPNIYETIVKFPPFPSNMTVAAALRYILGSVVTKNATYVVMPDFVLVTTYAMTSPQAKLSEKVRGTFDKRPLNVALRELSEMAGATIVVDIRAAEKAKAVVSATFLNDIDLAGALRVLTEMADLKCVVLDGAIFVTTPSHADALRKEHFDQLKFLQEKAAPRTGAPSGNPFQPDAEPLVDPLWPYVPNSRGLRGPPMESRSPTALPAVQVGVVRPAPSLAVKP